MTPVVGSGAPADMPVDSAPSTHAGRPGPSLGRRLASLEWGPPVIAFVGASLALYMAARLEGVSFFEAGNWFKGGSATYQQIAHQGYQLYQCTSAQYSGPLAPFCGDSSAFPGYPAILAVLDDLGLPQMGMAVVVSWFCDLAMLVVLWNGFLRRGPAPQSWLALAFAAACPGGIFLRAAFPLSMVAFFTLLWLLALRRGHWRWAGVAGGCAAVTYPSALVLAPLALAWIMAEDPRPRAVRLLRAVESSALTALGTLVALGLIAVEDHQFRAFFRAQSHYGRGLHEPFALLWPRMHLALGSATGVTAVEGTEALLAAFVVLVLMLGVIGLAIRGRATRWDGFLIAFAILSWLLPATQNNVGYYRVDSLLVVPAAILFVRMRIDVSIVLCAASLAVFPFLAYYFFGGQLI